ncbi:tyrosine-type recombinase/integrase [Hyphomicrobium sp. CS1GBMeth3]|uniref:tyrosine-type recombinase/integrase n=1 Tax=Hyphomicrobium sp. CS1GBMeth3 TaxID=1892845 RepID=UPI000930E5A7|nr:tyrosine-type recombinase/integrase [Hyphomicrobium sp. CS1GBMeth3]
MPRASTNNFSTDGELVSIAKAAKGNPRTEWRDTTTRGLVFITQPTGSCYWYLFYVPKTGEGLRKLKLGEYSREFSLKKAREIAVAKRADVDQGADPVVAAKAAKARIHGLRFRGLAERFLAENHRLSASTRKVYEYALKKDAYPRIGDKLVDDVTREDIIGICQAIEKRVKVDKDTKERHKPTSQSDHTRLTISAVFTWAVEEGLAKSNPALGIKKRGEKLARDREPTADEIKALWNGIEDRLSEAVRCIIRLSILTGQRRTEVAGARVSEIHGLDTDAPTWVIPGDVNKRGKLIEGRTKNGLTQIVPLSVQAAKLFREAMEKCANGEFVFPADTGRVKAGKKPRLPHVHGESVTMAMRRLRVDFELDDVSIHDMRRGVSNWLKNEGVSRDVRDLILNHKDQSVTEKSYTQNARMEKQVRAALQAWADHVTLIVRGKAAGGDKVVQLRA